MDDRCVKVRLTLLRGFHMPFDHSDVMGKPRSSRVTERSADMDYVVATNAGLHDPLGMTETAYSTLTINYFVLGCVVGHIHQRRREQVKMVVL